ncbi:hypothetical protein GQR58_013667 [Nymphon striatum]|nr:hypothetical protein GQR58_013667 [Nymphon striatum]
MVHEPARPIHGRDGVYIQNTAVFVCFLWTGTHLILVLELRIIRTFKRLRVLTPNFKFQGNMDELVNDLSLALQETSCVEGRSYGGRNRRRRGRKRRSKCTSNSGEGCSNFTCKHRSCFISEDSESTSKGSADDRSMSEENERMAAN